MLRLENVSYIVGDDLGEKGILKNVTVDIDARFVAITGPNGGGKSTLAKIIAGIVKPTPGKIYYDGVDITDYSVTEGSKLGISYAFQQPVRFKGITVNDLITLAALSFRGWPLRQRLHQPRGECQSFRRRIEADRDCHDPGKRHEVFCV